MPDDRARARAYMLRYGHDTVAYQGLGSQFSYWFDDENDACVAYVDTRGAWVAAGGPLCEASAREVVAAKFVAAARAANRRACFFAVDDAAALGPSFSTLTLGEHAEIAPAQWPATLAKHRRLREQLRRARAKGVTVRQVLPAELNAGASLRVTVDKMAAEWLAHHHLEPMHFLVSVELPALGPDRRAFVAELHGEVIALAWLVPIPARRGYMVEHLLRRINPHSPPNGTTELLLNAAIRHAADENAAVVSLGLAPLAGAITWPLRLARKISRPLYDFDSLHAFKQRLHPGRWQPSHLVYPQGKPLSSLLDSLRAFADGSLVKFGVRSIVHHPSGLPWLLLLPLVPWTILLAIILLIGHSQLLAYPSLGLAVWVAWDAILAWLVFRVARRPTRRRLVWLTGLAGADALWSALHLARGGFGHGWLAMTLRVLATAAPLAGTLALAWATSRAPPTTPRLSLPSTTAC